jgi:hypothetical protein
LEKIVTQFTFSPFTDDDQVTLYILSFPHCRVAERDTLHTTLPSTNHSPEGNAR